MLVYQRVFLGITDFVKISLSGAEHSNGSGRRQYVGKVSTVCAQKNHVYSRESKFGAILSHKNGGLSSCSRELMSEKGWNRTQELMEYLYNIWLVVSTVFHFP